MRRRRRRARAPPPTATRLRRGTPDYGVEVDIYSFGKMLFNLRQKVTDQQLSELCISLHAACTDIDLQRRPDAVQVAARLLPYVQASQGAMGNVRPTTNLNQLVLVGDAVRANHSRAGDTGSELRAVRAPPPAPRQIEWDTSDVPDDVDRDNVVYVSRSKYHHRKCKVVHTWHHRAYGGRGTTMQKSRFEDIARRVSIKPCSKCAAPAPIAHRRPCRPCRHPNTRLPTPRLSCPPPVAHRCSHRFRFKFNVLSGRGLRTPALHRPAPYPRDDEGSCASWMVKIREPDGDAGVTSFLGPIFAQQPFQARTQALRQLWQASASYRGPLRDPVREGAEYKETPSGHHANGSRGLKLSFETAAGDTVKVKVRRSEDAQRVGWPARGGGIDLDDLEYGDSEDEDDIDNEPHILFHSPGWGRLEDNLPQQHAAEQADLMHENQAFWAAMRRGEDPWDAL